MWALHRCPGSTHGPLNPSRMMKFPPLMNNECDKNVLLNILMNQEGTAFLRPVDAKLSWTHRSSPILLSFHHVSEPVFQQPSKTRLRRLDGLTSCGCPVVVQRGSKHTYRSRGSHRRQRAVRRRAEHGEICRLFRFKEKIYQSVPAQIMFSAKICSVNESSSGRLCL